MKSSFEQHDIETIADTVCERLEPKLQQMLNGSFAEEYLVDKHGAAKILGVTPEWIDNNYKDIPSYKVGGHRRYSPKELLQWVKEPC